MGSTNYSNFICTDKSKKFHFRNRSLLQVFQIPCTKSIVVTKITSFHLVLLLPLIAETLGHIAYKLFVILCEVCNLLPIVINCLFVVHCKLAKGSTVIIHLLTDHAAKVPSLFLHLNILIIAIGKNTLPSRSIVHVLWFQIDQIAPINGPGPANEDIWSQKLENTAHYLGFWDNSIIFLCTSCDYCANSRQDDIQNYDNNCNSLGNLRHTGDQLPK